MSADGIGPAACGCITCGDQGLPMQVLAVEPGGLARCREPGDLPAAPAGEMLVDVLLVEPVAAGDLVLVHAGAAIAVLSVAGGVEA